MFIISLFLVTTLLLRASSERICVYSSSCQGRLGVGVRLWLPGDQNAFFSLVLKPMGWSFLHSGWVFLFLLKCPGNRLQSTAPDKLGNKENHKRDVWITLGRWNRLYLLGKVGMGRGTRGGRVWEIRMWGNRVFKFGEGQRGRIIKKINWWRVPLWGWGKTCR